MDTQIDTGISLFDPKDTTTVRVFIQGVTPILMNPMSEDTLEGLRTKVYKQQPRDLTRKEDAGKKLYRGPVPEGEELGPIGMPVENLFACLVEAGRGVDLKARTKVSTKETTLLPAFLSIRENFMPFQIDGDESYDAEESWTPDTRRGRNPADKVAVAINRPKFERWGFYFTIDIDESQASEDLAKRLIQWAGRAVGLGDFRPACRGRFGQYAVVDWAVLKKAERRATVAAAPKKTRTRATAVSTNGEASEEQVEEAKEVVAVGAN